MVLATAAVFEESIFHCLNDVVVLLAGSKM
jgi:hypothetical protein